MVEMGHERPSQLACGVHACRLCPGRDGLVHRGGPPLCANTRHGQLFDRAILERRYLKLIKSVRLSVEAPGFKGSFVAFALF